jgi:acetoacetate decarboxylase
MFKFEDNKTYRMPPFFGGREESGQPKIYADIEDLHIFQQKHFTTVSFEGNTFLRLEMAGAQPVDEPVLAQIKAGNAEYIVFGWRYIPKVGGPGAELSQPILYPQGMKVDSAWTGRGAVQWTKLGWEQDESQWMIIEALAGLPVKTLSPVVMVKGAIVMKPFAGRVLE